MTLDENGNLYTEKEGDSRVTWQLEPILPHTISGKQIWSWVGLGITSAALVVAMPFAVIGVVGACGTAATLQSIGSVGLGIACTSMAVTAGADWWFGVIWCDQGS